ncbi:MAG TPA: calcium/proton exchanger [Bryobacteraceae bacterium]|jgi:Ca2+:H+ antiporter
MNWLLIFIPASVVLELMHAPASLIFLSSAIAIVPLAGWLGRATEQLAEHTGDGIGGLLNATFGNAAELIISIAGLQHGLYNVVKASLTGSIIGNLLLVLGASVLAGGLKYKEQRFNQQAASAQSTLMMLAAIGLVIPAGFHHLTAGTPARASESTVSLLIAAVLIIAYCLNLLFSLKTHRHFYDAEDIDVSADPPEETDQKNLDAIAYEETPWTLRKAMLVLAGATALVAWMSEILVGSVEKAALSFGMTSVFVGVVVVAIVGNAAEHSTSVYVAMKDRMDLSLAISLGSSTQIAVFVAPVLVFVSRFVGPAPMDLVFSPTEVLAVFLAAWIAAQICSDGTSNWIEGAQLLAVYAILAIAFYFLPDAQAVPAAGHP